MTARVRLRTLPRSITARALALAAGLLLPQMIPGAQWIVDDDGPADFRSIQTAIEAPHVHGGDTILVGPGVYYGNVVLDLKDLAIRSQGGPWVTILDGQQSGSVVSLTDRTAATRIEGFTIRGGRGQTGGGIWIYGGGPVVTRNVIEGNSAIGGFLGYGYGGGIEVYAAAPTITRNVIRGNTALDGGGGVDVYYAGPSTPGTCCPLIAQNTIAGNAVVSTAGMGGGILSSASGPWISSSIITGNQAASGGGLYVERMQGSVDLPEVSANIFYANSPGDVASNVNWRLPASNLHADPRLGPGPWTELWPRSDSPALDAGEGGLPAGADLTGLAGEADSDLDGAAAPDVGAIEGRGEITELAAAPVAGSPEAVDLSWDGALDPSIGFDLLASEAGPFTASPAVCLAAALAVPRFQDATPPPPGGVRFYLVAGRGAAAGILGMRSDGSVIPASNACVAP